MNLLSQSLIQFLSSFPHQCLLINHCIQPVIKPSSLKLLDFLSTFPPLISSFHVRVSILNPLIPLWAFVSDSPSGAFSSPSLSTDISAPWFQGNYIRINDDSPRLRLSSPLHQPIGNRTWGHSNHSPLCRRALVSSKSLWIKTKRDFFLHDCRVII